MPVGLIALLAGRFLNLADAHAPAAPTRLSRALGQAGLVAAFVTLAGVWYIDRC